MTKNYYVNGNTVRELEAPVRRDPRTRREMEEVRRRKNRRNAARRNRQRAMEMNRGYVVFLTGCVLVTALTAVLFVQMQSQMTNHMRSVASLESQVVNLRADNDARYKEITTSVDLNHVKDVAINELGMTYPKEKQVVYYSIENNNFMDQYRDIPKQ
ncbi:MAG: cell division protein FtsL [Lachnospiraceae bacterium]|nr:cell division protein FtsL [Agathobacter sp.]MDD6291397.1 cell division protein FtsL [Lachnospiraceae bacterium]